VGTSNKTGEGTGTAMAAVTGFMGGTVTGTAMFASVNTDVTVNFTLDGCVDTKVYNVHIHTGPACTDTTTQGGHWDMARGEGIPPVTCAGTTGTTTLTRPPADPAIAWTIGDGAASDVIGHLIVVHDPDVPMTRIGCGPIVAL